MKFVIFSASEKGENGDEGADGGNAPENFCARTAPVVNALLGYIEVILVVTQCMVHNSVFGVIRKLDNFAFQFEVAFKFLFYSLYFIL